MTDERTEAAGSERTGGAGRHRVWLALKWTLVAAVIFFVARRAADLWRQDELRNVQFHFGWLLLSGVVYVVGWLPSVWFWRRLLRALGGEVSWLDACRAYYCGHLGKYIPGKATVLVIRAGLLKDRGSRAGPAALTAAYETLLLMGMGLVVAFVLLPVLFGQVPTGRWPGWFQWWRDHVWWAPPVGITAVLLALPVLSRLLSLAAVKMVGQHLTDRNGPAVIPADLVAAGMLAFVIGWAIMGLSLGCTLRGVSDRPFDLADWPVWTAAVSFATSVGFWMIFAPGGVGVREGLLIEMLRVQPGIGTQQAVAAALLLRVVWLAAEIAGAAGLYYVKRLPAGRGERA